MSQQPCLPVSKIRKDQRDAPDGFNCINLQEMDAGDYLSLVVEEANRLPEVFCSKKVETNTLSKRRNELAIHGSAASLSYLLSDRTVLHLPPTIEHLPNNTQKWVDQTLFNFSKLRDYLHNCLQKGVGGRDTNRLPLPPMKDRSAWHTFCVGINEAMGNADAYFDVDHHSEDGEVDKPHEEAWKKSLPEKGYNPTTSLLLQMDQVMIRRVLGHLVHFVQEGWNPVIEQRSLWFYALLARLERPLHRDDAALLYRLLRTLTLQRANLSAKELQNDQLSLSKLNVLIAVVGIYFEQGCGFANVMTMAVRR
jgi:survival of motor neuron protein-interacting protein 1